jgi:unsaturated chondroitin disaccharide hydrolase
MVPAGKWIPMGIPNPNGYVHWAGGYTPGSLWYLYQKTADTQWRDWAEEWTVGLANEPNRTKDHESGFTVYRSYGLGYHSTGNPDYKPQIIKATENLMLRYNPVVGCIKSWALIENPIFEVITDGMMMLEMVFWASKNGGDPNWYDMAVSHCYKTIENNVRPNGSNWQIVEYNPATGDVIVKWGKQSIDDPNLPKGSFETTWSRGQAWGINGFTMAYRETNDPNMLTTAKKMADYFIEHLSPDYVPYWDFNAPDYPGWSDAKDTSAAAIAASGLLELSTHVTDQMDKEKYYNTACNILDSLCSPAYLTEGTNSMGLLQHAMANGNRPGTTEFDTSLMYADHFFIEALLRKEQTPVP